MEPQGARPHGLAPEVAEISSFESLAAELKAAFRDWEASPHPWTDVRVTDLARRGFRLQYEGNRPYRLYCRRLGVSPADIADWRDIPPVPTAAFREVPLYVGDPAGAEAVFLTSGTTRGPDRRGRHHVRDLGLYRASLEAAFARHVMDGPAPVRILSLIPLFEPARESSLSWMADALLARFGAPGSEAVADPDGIRWDAALRALEAVCAEGAPVCVLGTTLAIDAWMGELERRGARFDLPGGSRAMDTGGAKGRAGLDRSGVLARLHARLGLLPDRVVNEFGMTELLSQRYSRPALPRDDLDDLIGRDGRDGRDGPNEPAGTGAGPGEVPLHAPPWLRSRAVDPVSLEPLPAEETGVLCHLDLANLGSVASVLTEDLGRARGEVVWWVDRAAGAPPRGCSLATAELLAAQAGNGG